MNYHKEALKAFASNVCLVSSLTKEELNKLFEYLSATANLATCSGEFSQS